MTRKLDNTPDIHAKEAVERARKTKVLLGDETGNERLHDNITRQDALVVIYRALKAESLIKG